MSIPQKKQVFSQSDHFVTGALCIEMGKRMLIDVLFPIDAGPFTYLLPQEIESECRTGIRVLAPFRGTEKVGIVTGFHAPDGVDDKLPLKTIKRILDEEPLIHDNLLMLIKWVGEYYLSKPGMALKNALPSGLFTPNHNILKGDSPKPSASGGLSRGSGFTGRKSGVPEQKALAEINSASSGVFLLHGVRGSGRTEIYLRVIESLEDKGAIVLLPEIALTAQIVDRFRDRFGGKVAFFHSGVSSGERISEWWRIRNGDVRVVLGVRSAVFAPFMNLGLIVVDEEQETSYKQFEGLRYNARDVAVARGRIENIKVILGSATPSIESFYNAQKGRFKYLQLKHRIAPRVQVLDMTKESKKTWSFSDKLLNALKENLSKGRQSLIMLNRRGYSPFLICTDCGYTYKCPACSIILTYHKDTRSLNCHYCGSYLMPGDFCPRCKGTKIRYVGAGTQRVEEELRNLIPQLSLRRMDRDTTRKKLSRYMIIKEMEEKRLDVLLGTQMVVKGGDFHQVTLSAVVFADVALNLPDFRSAERAFQLFSQLAGRGQVSGEVYIQTYEPQHYVFQYVRNHDYKGFYEKEIELRKELSYPPFSKLIRIILGFKNKDSAIKIIKDISNRCSQFTVHSSQGIEILGPAPAPLEKIRNLWRWHLILKGRDSEALRQKALEIIEMLRDIKYVKTQVDVDPIDLM